MTCAWCQRETSERYVVYKTKRKLNGSLIPLCPEHKALVVGADALPSEHVPPRKVADD